MTQPHGEFSIGGDLWPGLSKLIEECGEVGQVAGKIIGNEGGADHWDGSHLPTRLVEEMGDVIAAIFFVAKMNGLDEKAIDARAAEKFKSFERWHGETQARRAA
jgi:NTP pyrophosphatase (non-canonical NTP hydrolase)